jgi:ABC-type sugar transport system ATPase subunit
MNLLAIDQTAERTALAAACGGALPAACPSQGYIGIRPEYVRLGAEGLPVKIAAVDYLGAETVVRLTHGDQPVFARIDGRRDYAPGEAVHISWPQKAVHCFGADGICIEDARPSAP